MNGMELKELLDVAVAKAVKEFADRLKIAFHFYIVKNEDTGEEINTDDFIDELLNEYEVYK